MTDLTFKGNNTAEAKERINSSVSEVLDPYTDLDLPTAGETATINDITRPELIEALGKVINSSSDGFTTESTYGSIGNSGELAVVQATLQALEASPGPIDGAIGPMTRAAFETFKTNYNAGNYTGGTVPGVQLTSGLSSPEALNAMIAALGGTPVAVDPAAAEPMVAAAPVAAAEEVALAPDAVASLSEEQREQVKAQAQAKFDEIRTRFADGFPEASRDRVLEAFDGSTQVQAFNRLQEQELTGARLTRINNLLNRLNADVNATLGGAPVEYTPIGDPRSPEPGAAAEPAAAELTPTEVSALGRQALDGLREAYADRAVGSEFNSYERARYTTETAGLRDAHTAAVRTVAETRFNDLPAAKQMERLLAMDPADLSESQVGQIAALAGTLQEFAESGDPQQRIAHVRDIALNAPERLTETATALSEGVYAEKLGEVRASIATFDMSMVAGQDGYTTIDPMRRAEVEAQLQAVYQEVAAGTEMKLSEVVDPGSDRNNVISFENNVSAPTDSARLDTLGTYIESIVIDEDVTTRASIMVGRRFNADPRVQDIIQAFQYVEPTVAADPVAAEPVIGPDGEPVAEPVVRTVADVKADPDFVTRFSGLGMEAVNEIAQFIADGTATVTEENFGERPLVARFAVQALGELGLDAYDGWSTEPYAEDFAFNSQITKSLVYFQRTNGLEPTGFFDVNTLNKMVDQLQSEGLRSETDTWLDGRYQNLDPA